MFSLSGNSSKGEKSKQKYQSLDINNLYMRSRGESTDKPVQKNSSTVVRHGMQLLGKVPTARKAPANLPSLKSEHNESGAAVALVPPGSTGWGKQEQGVPNAPNSERGPVVSGLPAAPPQLTGQAGPPPVMMPPAAAPPPHTDEVGPQLEMLPPQVRSVFPQFMCKNSYSQGISTSSHAHPQQIPPSTIANSGRRMSDNRPQRFQERDVTPEELTPRPIIREEELSKLDKVGHDMGWAASDDIDYTQKLAFSDDEGDRPPKENTKISVQSQYYNPPPKVPDSKNERQTPPRQWNSPRNDNYRSHQSDDEEFFAQKQKQYKEEVGLAIQRAKQRKAEEEKRFKEESKQRAQKKLMELDNKPKVSNETFPKQNSNEKVHDANKRDRPKEFLPEGPKSEPRKAEKEKQFKEESKQRVQKKLMELDNKPKASSESFSKQNTNDKPRDKRERIKDFAPEIPRSEPRKVEEENKQRPQKKLMESDNKPNVSNETFSKENTNEKTRDKRDRIKDFSNPIKETIPSKDIPTSEPPKEKELPKEKDSQKDKDSQKEKDNNAAASKQKPSNEVPVKDNSFRHMTQIEGKSFTRKKNDRDQVSTPNYIPRGEPSRYGRGGTYYRGSRLNNNLTKRPDNYGPPNQRNSQNKLPPRFAKQKMQKYQQQMVKDAGDTGKPRQPAHSSSSMYGIKETPQVSSSSSNAWDKPLGSQLLPSETDNNNMLCMSMDAVELNANSPSPAHAPSPGNDKVANKQAQIADKNLVDGSTPPLKTIIFENTNYKSGPGVLSTLRNTASNSMNLASEKSRSKLEEDIENTVFRKSSISDLLQKGGESNPKPDAIPLSAFKEESDMKLDFFGSDLTQLTEDKVTKALCTTKSITPVNSTICNADSLNMKIASVKKVWETTEQEADETSLSFGGPVLDTVFKGNDGQDDVENYNGGNNQVPSSTNVCKVKPTQQVSNAPGQPVSSSSQQTHSTMISHSMLLNTPLSPPPMAPAPVGVSLGAQAFAGNQHLANFQTAPGPGVAAAGSAQFSISAIPSPPTVLYNTKQQMQTTGLYRAFMQPPTDQSAVIGWPTGHRPGGFGQYQTAGSYHGLGQAATSYNNQSVYLQATPSNSLMSATVKPSTQPISAIGAPAGYYQQPANSTMPSPSPLPQHQPGYDLQGNVFGTHNQSNSGMQGFQSYLSTQMQVAALNVQNVPQQYRSSALPNAYFKEGQPRYPAPIQRPHNFPPSNPMNSMANNGSNNQKHNRNNPNKTTNKYYSGQHDLKQHYSNGSYKNF